MMLIRIGFIIAGGFLAFLSCGKATPCNPKDQTSLVVVSDVVVIPDVQAVSQKGWHPAVLNKFQRPYHEVVIKVCNECAGDSAVFTPNSVEVCDSTLVMTACFFYPPNSGHGEMNVGIRVPKEILLPASKCCRIEYRIEKSIQFQSDILSYRDRCTTENLLALCFDKDTVGLAENLEFQMEFPQKSGQKVKQLFGYGLNY